MKCPACGESSRLALQEHINGYDKVHCDSCTLLFAQPMKGAGRDHYSGHDTHRYWRLKALGNPLWDVSKEGWRCRRVLEELTDLLKGGSPRTAADMAILDVGCANGRVLGFLKRAGFHHVHGVDFDEKIITVAKSLFPGVEFLLASWEEHLNDARCLYDVIIALDLIEHLENPLEFLASAYRAANPGGGLLLTTPNRYRWNARFQRSDMTTQPPIHLTWWTKESLAIALKKTGWRMEKVTFYYPTLYPLLTSTIRFGLVGKRARGGSPVSRTETINLEGLGQASNLLQLKDLLAKAITLVPDLFILRMLGFQGETLFTVGRKPASHIT